MKLIAIKDKELTNKNTARLRWKNRVRKKKAFTKKATTIMGTNSQQKVENETLVYSRIFKCI